MTMPKASSPPSTTPITIALAAPPTSGPPVIYYITANGSYSPGTKLDWHVRVIATHQDTVIHTEDAQWFSWTSSADRSADPNLSRGQYLTNMAYLTRFNPTTGDDSPAIDSTPETDTAWVLWQFVAPQVTFYHLYLFVL